MANKKYEVMFSIAGKVAGSFTGAFKSANKAIDDANKKTKAWKDNLKNLEGIAKKGIVIGGVIAAGAGLATKAFMDAESASTDLKSSMMGIGGKVSKDFEKINKLAGELGAQLPGSTAEFTEMMNVLVKEGIPSKQILDGMGKSAAYLGVVMKMEYPEAAKFVAQLADATQVAGKDMLDFMDVVQRMAHTGLDADYMLQGFGKMASGMNSAKMAGIEGVKAMSPFLAMLGNSGMTDGSAAGNAMSKIIKSSIKSTQGAESKFFKEYGKHAPKLQLDKKGEFGGIENLYKQLDKLKGLTTQERDFYLAQQFGNDAETLQALNIIMNKGYDGYKEMVKKMEMQANISERVGVQLGTLANLWDAAKGAFDAILIAVGESYADELKALVEWMSNVQEKLLVWKEANPELFKQITRIVLVVGGLVVGLSALALGAIAFIGPIMMVIGALSKFGFIITIIKSVGTAFLWLGRIFLMNPIGLAITAVIAVIWLLWKNWDTVCKYVGIAWEGIKSFFTSGIGNISATIVNWSPIGLFYRAFSAVMNWFGVLLPSTFTEFGRNLLQGLANGIKNGVSAAVNAAGEAVEAVKNKVKNFFGINSPSKLFAQFGEWNMEGLAIGMQAGAPMAENASDKALSGVLPKANGQSLTNNSSMNSNYTVNIQQTIQGGNNVAEQAKLGALSAIDEFKSHNNRNMRTSFA